MNKLFDNNITLDRDSHVYKLASHPDLEFISATTFVGQFFAKFEGREIPHFVKNSQRFFRRK